MRFLVRCVAYGSVVWLFTLITSMALFPVKSHSQTMFDSIMPVALASFTVLLLRRYGRKHGIGSAREGAWVGAIWLFVNVLLDLPLFSFGPMKMTLANYFADIGLTYLIIPVITVGATLRLSQSHAEVTS